MGRARAYNKSRNSPTSSFVAFTVVVRAIPRSASQISWPNIARCCEVAYYGARLRAVGFLEVLCQPYARPFLSGIRVGSCCVCVVVVSLVVALRWCRPSRLVILLRSRQLASSPFAAVSRCVACVAVLWWCPCALLVVGGTRTHLVSEQAKSTVGPAVKEKSREYQRKSLLVRLLLGLRHPRRSRSVGVVSAKLIGDFFACEETLLLHA